MLPTLLTTLAVIVIAMVLLWLVSLWRRDASIADAFWGTGFILVAWTAWYANAPSAPRVLLLVWLTTLWGLRLSGFLLWRNIHHGEDRRYTAMRIRYGPRFGYVSLFTVFLLQGGILWLVSLPIQVAAVQDGSQALGWGDACGLLIWSAGLLFETVSDWQLARFRADPANAHRVFDRGLWRYSRHPNYFGDFCIWWGIYCIAAGGGAAWTVGSPLLMSWLLLRVSGVTLLERTIADRRPDFADYKARTNAFFPGWPRSRS